jgi:hypothetical protein
VPKRGETTLSSKMPFLNQKSESNAEPVLDPKCSNRNTGLSQSATSQCGFEGIVGFSSRNISGAFLLAPNATDEVGADRVVALEPARVSPIVHTYHVTIRRKVYTVDAWGPRDALSLALGI